jgi:hypothetical protein
MARLLRAKGSDVTIAADRFGTWSTVFGVDSGPQHLPCHSFSSSSVAGDDFEETGGGPSSIK